MDEKKCAYCGNTYKISNRLSLKQRNQSRYCSYKCRGKSLFSSSKKQCARCGKDFYVPKYRDKTARYCSVVCRKVESSYDKSTGYQRIHTDRYIGVHRHLVEKNIGKILDKNTVVHHINGKKTDNRLENLIVMTRAEHTSYHARLRKK